MKSITLTTSMQNEMSRRQFLSRSSGVAVAGSAVLRSVGLEAQGNAGLELGVHHYSVKALVDSGQLPLLKFPRFARDVLHVKNIEIAEEFSGELLDNPSQVRALREEADRAGVRILTFLCGGEFLLDAETETERDRAVAHHQKWVRIGRQLNCRFMRLRAGGPGPGHPELRLEQAVAGIGALAASLQEGDPRLLVENVAGLSRRPDWLVALAKRLGREQCGLLADYGNFEGDLYEGMAQLLPYTESICTKSWEFDDRGRETKIDYEKMGAVIKGANFRGCYAMEYLGQESNPVAGIRRTADLIKKHW